MAKFIGGPADGQECNGTSQRVVVPVMDGGVHDYLERVKQIKSLLDSAIRYKPFEYELGEDGNYHPVNSTT